MKINFTKYLLFLLLGLTVQTMGQTNLDVISGFNDSSVAKIKSNFSYGTNQKIYLADNFSSGYSYFHNKLFSGFAPLSIISTKPAVRSKDSVEVNYFIEKISVEYGEVFRKGILGDFYVSRSIIFNANYAIKGAEEVQNSLNYKFVDTIKVDEIKKVESDPFIFTKGEPPKEYVYPTLLEPVIALGISAAVIILFFTIRSK
ncbi:MAG: hypothetical protein Q8903_05710 [Bacteroidota bacterium]|nr:hypothetical protein [Bacteroidota bacterium]